MAGLFRSFLVSPRKGGVCSNTLPVGFTSQNQYDSSKISTRDTLGTDTSTRTEKKVKQQDVACHDANPKVKIQRMVKLCQISQVYTFCSCSMVSLHVDSSRVYVSPNEAGPEVVAYKCSSALLQEQVQILA